LVDDRGSAQALSREAAERGPLVVMRPAERELREELRPLVESGALRVVRHEGFLTTREDFLRGAGPKPPYRLDAFYRHVRNRTGLLMIDGEPEGGRYSFDADNRRPWRGDPPAPEPPRFQPDAITREVGDLVATRFSRHPGVLALDRLPATRADADTLWRWARSACLPHFGPFEDAMSSRSTGLFHSRISPLLNLHRLTPRRVVTEIAGDEELPLQSREGFVRQILGWRELVRHVHDETDGLRRIAPRGEGRVDAPATPNALAATEPLPAAYWGTPSGLACLDHTVRGVLDEGHGHHITRLMVLSNVATLLGVDPRELTDWFWAMYTDAYDWVVEPNVLAMGTFAAGELMTTKPYVSGAAYLAKMSDHCASCAFDPRTSCPITRLYWAFLDRHVDRFAKNPRMAGPVASVRRRGEVERAEDARVLALVRETLRRGLPLAPADVVGPEPARAAPRRRPRRAR
jgi:deoxyribodipyrimidine photolyase-related protein